MMDRLINFQKGKVNLVRKLDVIVPTFNRPERLFNFITSALKLKLDFMYLIIIDDGSTVKQKINGVGTFSTIDVCKHFKNSNVLYYKNKKNIGVASSWKFYYSNLCNADYTLSVTDKDEFISGKSIISAIKRMDEDKNISASMIPLRQKDRYNDDTVFKFNYEKQISGKEYLYHYVRDNTLMHCSMWGVYRSRYKNKLIKPKSMNLWSYELDDGFGIDLDFVWRSVVKGDVIFFHEPHVRRSTISGGTEKFPLTFAYTYYQYAKRITNEFFKKKIITENTMKIYKAMWIKLILRGFIVSLSHVHGSEMEIGRSRIKNHLKIPVIIYVFFECLRNGIKIKDHADDFLSALKASFKIIFGKSLKIFFSKIKITII